MSFFRENRHFVQKQSPERVTSPGLKANIKLSVYSLSGVCVLPVSYTHLDVYKRQNISRPSKRSPSSCCRKRSYPHKIFDFAGAPSI